MVYVQHLPFALVGISSSRVVVDLQRLVIGADQY
jgi:hypothetical protein